MDVTFENEGLYKYLCSFHASPEGDWGMVGSVVVGDINYENYSNFQKDDVVKDFSGTIRKVPKEYESIQDDSRFFQSRRYDFNCFWGLL